MYCILPYVSGVVLSPRLFLLYIYRLREAQCNISQTSYNYTQSILFIIMLIRLKCSMLIKGGGPGVVNTYFSTVLHSFSEASSTATDVNPFWFQGNKKWKPCISVQTLSRQ
jgi:hypothetical protein